MRSRIWTLFWIFGILFPMASLGRLWPPFGRVFNALFAAEWTHRVMHTFLYAVLVFLLAQWIRPVSAKAIFMILGLAVVIGCCQEGLQWFTIKSEIGWSASAFDLMVDFGGALLGLVLAPVGHSRVPGRSVPR
jgi:VanZ family protein